MRIANTEVEVLTQPERRRRWSDDQKRAIVAEMLRPGASATRVARRHGISTGLLYSWRRLVLSGALPAAPSAAEAAGFVPIHLLSGDSEPLASALSQRPEKAAAEGEMIIELAGDRRLRVDRQVDAAALRRVLQVLEER
jgi:transposase